MGPVSYFSHARHLPGHGCSSFRNDRQRRPVNAALANWPIPKSPSAAAVPRRPRCRRKLYPHKQQPRGPSGHGRVETARCRTCDPVDADANGTTVTGADTRHPRPRRPAPPLRRTARHFPTLRWLIGIAAPCRIRTHVDSHKDLEAHGSRIRGRPAMAVGPPSPRRGPGRARRCGGRRTGPSTSSRAPRAHRPNAHRAPRRSPTAVPRWPPGHPAPARAP